MGIFVRIQRFVDNLDVSSKYYYYLLFSELVLISVTYYLKNEVFADQVFEETHPLSEIFADLAKLIGFAISP